ncbi:MAG: protease SohB [Calditrichaeota bacterium]|nr:MAG: protease SohB [Calditrichota bacterium]
MLDFLSEYGMFLLKTATVLIAFVLMASGAVTAIRRGRRSETEQLNVWKLNKHFDELRDVLQDELLSPAERKKAFKEKKKHNKQEKKEDKLKAKNLEKKKRGKRRVFVLNFKGDVWASSVHALREEISALLPVVQKNDEVVVRLESGGGVVHDYGLAASQLKRLRSKKVKLTILVDKIAASGGYMMACVADKLIAAPFAIIGSIGVLAEMPNFNRLLKKLDIDYEQITAGEYKRTLTVFGQNTKEAREKMVDQLEDIHLLFKDFIREHRPKVQIENVATGEYWHGTRALELGLIDGTQTSDDYLLNSCKTADVYEIEYKARESVREKIVHGLEQAASGTIMKIWERMEQKRYL